MLPQYEKQISRSPEERSRILERKLKGEREVIDTEALERERVKLASQAEIEITCPRESVVREILGRTGCENMMFL
jgi:hypothetical protein